MGTRLGRSISRTHRKTFYIQQRAMKTWQAAVPLLLLELGGLVASRTVLQAESVPPDDPSCVNTTAGLRVSVSEGEAPLYPSPCSTSQPVGSVAKCEVFNYLGLKAVSSCGDGQCYRQVTTDDGTTGWLVDHAVGSKTTNVTAVDAPACAQPTDPTCSNTEAGQRVYVGEGTSPIYPSPCATSAQPTGSVGHCEVFDYLGLKSVSTCEDGLCFRQITTSGGITGWIVDHPLGSSTASNVSSADDPTCASTEPEPQPAVDQQVDASRASITAEVTAALQDEASTEAYFQQWMGQAGASYAAGSPEYAARLVLFQQSLSSVLQVNSKAATYWAAPNQFADRSPEERAGYLGATLMPVPTPEAEGTELIERRRRLQRSLLEVPTVVDWTAEGKVTPVGNQAGCGACWAFAAAGAVEAKYKISNGQDWDLSEQQLVDCLAHSCGGGDPAVALEYIYGYGLVPEAAYPFIGTSSSYLCNTSVLAGVPASDRAHLLVGQGFTFLESFSATELMKAVAQQPTIVGLDAEDDLLLYAGGIMQPTVCKNTTKVEELNHAVLVVGYNATGGAGAPGTWWKIKNSWGTGWGEQGYFKIQMTADGTPGACGMYSYVVAPLEVGQPPEGTEGYKTFNNPQFDGVALDWCLEWETPCGEPAASHFCSLFGYNSVADYGGPVALTEGAVATVIPKTGDVCSPLFHGCHTFSFIKCGWIG